MSHAPNLAPQAELEISIAPVPSRDMPYCLGSWRETLKTAPGNQRVPWGMFRRSISPELVHVLNTSEVLGAYADGSIVGWIAVSRGRRVNACHWVHTRYETPAGEPLRRRGIMTALFDAADLGPRFLYTRKGGLPRHRTPGVPKTTSDEIVRRWLSSRGITAVFTPYQEWIR